MREEVEKMHRKVQQQQFWQWDLVLWDKQKLKGRQVHEAKITKEKWKKTFLPQLKCPRLCTWHF